MSLLAKFLLFDRFSNMCLASTLEPLRAATDLGLKQRYQWSIETLDGQSVASSSGLRITPDQMWDPAASCDYLFVIASYGGERLANKSVAEQLRMARRHATTVIGIDTGPWILAQAGLLDGHTATLHQQIQNQFAEKFLDVETMDQPLVWTDQDRLVTCADASGALRLSCQLIERDIGSFARFDVETLFLGQRFVGTTSDAGSDFARQSKSPITHRAIELALEYVEDPIDLASAAKTLQVSVKRLNRYLKDELGMSYKAMTMHVRLSKARQLAQLTDMRALEIAVRTGFSSASNLHRAYRDHYGQGLFDIPPSAQRPSHTIRI